MALFRKKERAQFTVEAAVIMPLLIIVTMASSYLVVYAYDRALLNQDMNAAVAELRVSEEYFSKTCRLIKTDHPYIGVTTPSIYISKVGNQYEITMKCTWTVPIWNGYEKDILVSRKVDVTSPTSIMRVTDDVITGVKELKENED